MTEWLLLLLLVTLGWFWLDTVSKRDIAMRIGQQLAERCQLQFLDETVACAHIGFSRDGQGRMQLQRTYTFDVSNRGVERMACHLQLRGKHLVAWHIPPYVTQ